MINSLTFDQLEEYNKKGFLVLRNVFSEYEVAVWNAEIERLLHSEYIDPNNVRVNYRKWDSGESVIEKFDPIQDISPVIASLTQDNRILNPLRDIYMDEPLLFKDKLIFKLPGNSGYTMHQDAAFWQPFPMEGLISVMVAIDGATTENGALELFPGYHDRLISAAGEVRNFNAEEAALVDPNKGELYETNPGDIIIFHSFVPHQSGVNNTDSSRKQLYLTYSPAQNGQLYEWHYRHYQKYITRRNDEETLQRIYYK
ncbi:phytanoyl-CoA dioxygenase family protein [Paenibacillus piri]|nr:phytanoyl-CoA dioxygenase family protein [Paenibacillus piri]